MTRSKWKGPFVSENLLKSCELNSTNKFKEMFTFERSTVIVPKLLGLTINIHNGKSFSKLLVKETMLGKKLGEFSPTRKKFTFKKKK